MNIKSGWLPTGTFKVKNMRKEKIKFDFSSGILDIEKRRLYLRELLFDYKKDDEYQKLTREFRRLVLVHSNGIVADRMAMAYFYGIVATGVTPLKASEYAENYIGNDALEVVVRIDGNL